MKSGQFISIEGMDGAGKTSVMATLVDWLQAQSHSVVTTREPGGTPLAEALRDLLLAPRDEVMDEDAELLLMVAARTQHVKTKIQPALAAGQWVVSDRFFDASFAYQGGGRGLSIERIASLHEWAIGDFAPALTLLLDVPVAIGKARVAGRGEEETRFELEKMDFFERVRTAYLARAAAEPNRVVVIDATQPPEAVQAAVIAVLQMHFPLPLGEG
jgi:dTMP kinase